MSVTVTKDKLADVLKSIKALTGQQVLVGIPAKDAARRDSPINNAGIGYVQEFGAPAQNIPARPFLIPGVEAALPAATKQLQRGAKGALDGKMDAAEKGMEAAGLVAQSSVKAVMGSGIPPPLEDSTLAARKRRGRTGITPLIDTGELRNSITYVIRKAK